VASYTIAVAGLLRGEARDDAFARAKEWADRRESDEVREWLRQAYEGAPVDFLSHIGFVRIAFVNAFQHLLRGSTYETCLRETLGRGGDTDTNACIAGALVGAATGAGGIPEPMKTAVVGCDTRQGRLRPEFLQGGRVPELAKALLSAAA